MQPGPDGRLLRATNSGAIPVVTIFTLVFTWTFPAIDGEMVPLEVKQTFDQTAAGTAGFR